MRLKEWGAFWLLGSIWGSSFLWIKIALAEIGPLTLVAFRLLFGLVGLITVVSLRKQRVSRDRKTTLAFLFLAIFNTAFPFALISWGETSIDSGLAAMLNGTVPLFTIVIAHFWLHDEKITFSRAGGLVVGFIGVAVLVSRDLDVRAFQGSLLGQLAVISAAVSYAVAATFSRKHLKGQSPVVQATMVVLLADALIWTAVPIAESPVRVPALPVTWFALAWLGLLGSCVAYMLYFYLISTWGATRATLVTYVFPIIGLILGIVFLGEAVDLRLAAGSVLVIGGIVVVNLRVGMARTARRNSTQRSGM